MLNSWHKSSFPSSHSNLRRYILLTPVFHWRSQPHGVESMPPKPHSCRWTSRNLMSPDLPLLTTCCVFFPHRASIAQKRSFIFKMKALWPRNFVNKVRRSGCVDWEDQINGRWLDQSKPFGHRHQGSWVFWVPPGSASSCSSTLNPAVCCG